MIKYILDTSVLIKWFSEYDEDDLDNAVNLRNKIFEGECSVIVPSLLFYEVANALRYNTRFTNKDVKDAVKSIIDMTFEVREVDKTILERAIEIAFKYNISVYDAYFLSLSQIENMPFITADYKFVDRVKGFKNIIKLSEIS
ncbi:MAG: type II toxin-antitoxin system VapC family toxin [Nitrospinae bacterium]|nr:type II toxin-antitoxin system VapC family toxin [Nitrospinota bacterium]